MENYFNIAVQILFALAVLLFVIYSIVAIYTLNTYGRSKTVTTTLTFLYSGTVIGLMGWAWIILG